MIAITKIDEYNSYNTPFVETKNLPNQPLAIIAIEKQTGNKNEKWIVKSTIRIPYTIPEIKEFLPEGYAHRVIITKDNSNKFCIHDKTTIFTRAKTLKLAKQIAANVIAAKIQGIEVRENLNCT